MRSRSLVIVGATALALIAAACGGDGGIGTGTESSPRTIEVAALDALTFEPATVEVAAGETIRFVVTNEGETDHELVVGDDEMQSMAEEQAMEGMHGHTDAMASLPLAPGETAEATITFDESGELRYACHVEGHYEDGMVGTISVT